MLPVAVSVEPSRQSNRLGFKVKSLLCLSLVVGAGLWFGYRFLRAQLLQPQALLVLGGSPRREVFAAQFARSNPDLEIWISGGSNPEYSEWVFAEAGVDLDRLHLDYQAVDTVTNFTTLVDEFKARGIESIYLVTSDDHMRRACVIGEIVLGSRGISFKPISVPSGREPEPAIKAIRDGARSILWVIAGRSGSTFKPTVSAQPDEF
ncbi:MAG TPA: YdcF family protein [Oscillatoriales cyanobacterium M59_W2019_021]|nr:MAG: YdcF family protein [Cyanobacteria bacterium J055]HIK32005.1 YdcF family protein [Oscillatoriales cyanobacterium M4454_W2019_049]HIK49477.1 YdcF family protein [Oscillatoriales cyanobacterium M59_W2019_021]